MIPASGAGGPGFDPRNSPLLKVCFSERSREPPPKCHVPDTDDEALLPQWLERAAVNRKVTGSIPVGSGPFPKIKRQKKDYKPSFD